MIQVGSLVKVRAVPLSAPWVFEREGHRGIVEDGPLQSGAVFVRFDRGDSLWVPQWDLHEIEDTPLLTGATSEAGGDAKFADAGSHPSHYAGFAIEPITFINANGIGFNRGNIIKYVTRAGRKGGPEKELEDLKKAQRYLNAEMECIERRKRVGDGEAPSEVWKTAP